jgi:hypothetical protein
VKDLQELTARRAGREILACALALSLVAVVTGAGHILAGGFYYDDWGVLALGRFPPPAVCCTAGGSPMARGAPSVVVG